MLPLSSISRPCGMLVFLTYGTNILATYRATELFVLMHSGSGIVNVYQLMCDAHTISFLGCLYSLFSQSIEDSRLSCDSMTGHLICQYTPLAPQRLVSDCWGS